jgi:CRP/FNR family cyclic AMP-dependent transcriptional regulator
MSQERTILNWENDEKADALDKTRWAHDFEWSELEVLASYMLAIEFTAGSMLFREREPGSFMALLLSGEASVLKEGSDDLEHAIATIKPGTSIGEMAMIDGESRSATIIMSKDSRILMLDEEDFADMYENDIKVWALLHRKLARLLSQRLRATSGRLLDALSP